IIYSGISTYVWRHRMKKTGSLVALAALAASGCVSQGTFDEMQAAKNREIQGLQSQRGTLETQVQALQSQKTDLEREKSSLSDQEAELRRQVQAREQAEGDAVRLADPEPHRGGEEGPAAGAPVQGHAHRRRRRAAAVRLGPR